MTNVEIGKRESTKYASVTPPVGNWCLAANVESAGVLFRASEFTGEFVEESPTFAELSRTYVVGVRHYKVKDIDISTSSAIKAFLQEWYEVRGIAVLTGSEYYLELITNEEQKRFELIDLIIEEDDTFDAQCVRFETTENVTDNKFYPPWEIKLTETGYFCKSPYSSQALISASFIERRLQGIGDSTKINKLRSEAEEVLKSLEFLDPG